MEISAFQKLLINKALMSGFEDCEVYFEGGKSFEVLIQDGEIAHYENSIQKGISFRGTYHNKMGYSYSEQIELEAIDFLIKEAKQNAEIIEDMEKEELYKGEKNYPQIDGFHEDLQNITPLEKIYSAKCMELAAKEESGEIIAVDYCLVSYGEGEISIANTKGLNANYKNNLGNAYISTIAKREKDIKTGSEFWIGNDYSLFNSEQLGKEASQQAISHLGAESIKSGVYKVVLKNQVVSNLLGTFAGVFFGENVQKGFSLLSGKIGQKIANDLVTIKDDGLYEGGFSTTPFDSEGVKSCNKAVIDNGILKTYLYNLKSAKKDGVQSTGNGFKPSYKSPVQTACTNFYICKGTKSTQELFYEMCDGLYITEVAGLHSGTNIISGDFSLSAEGFLIKSGSIVKPIEQITIAGNFYELLNDIVEIGSEFRFNMPGGNGTIGAPMIYLKKIVVSGL